MGSKALACASREAYGGAWAEWVDEGVARSEATRRAALAYRALVGPLPRGLNAAEVVAFDPCEALLACLTAWAGGCREAVDEGRARRLFWIQWLGPVLFAELFPEAPAVGVTDLPPAGAGLSASQRGCWQLVTAGPRHALEAPLGQLEAPWPREVALLILLAVHGVPRWPALDAGGAVRCPEAPFGEGW